MAQTQARAPAQPKPRPRWLASRRLPLLALYLTLGLVALAGAVRSETFRTPDNLLNVLRQSIPLGLASIGQTFVVLSGGIDLSVGSIAKLSSMVAALVMDGRSEMLLPGVAAALLVGLGLGLANGLIVTRLNVPPFIATFGVFSVARGIALAISTTPVGKASPPLFALYDARALGVPLAVAGMLALWLLAALALRRTLFGRHLYAVGGQPDAARLAGIAVQRVRLGVYLVSGLLAAAAGLFTLSRGGIGDPNTGEGLEMDAITAVVLGGTSLFGGRGGLLGTFGGVLLLALINNVLNMLQVDQWYQQLAKGLIIVAAVALYRQRS